MTKRYVGPPAQVRYQNMMKVLCWCKATTVGVPQKDVMRCLTLSCGAPDCGPTTC